MNGLTYDKVTRRKVRAKIRHLWVRGATIPEIHKRLSAEGVKGPDGNVIKEFTIANQVSAMGLRRRKVTRPKLTAVKPIEVDVPVTPKKAPAKDETQAFAELVVGSNLEAKKKLNILRELLGA